MSEDGYGDLAGALAKAQAAFPAIPRDKEVTVEKRAGGSYKFKYAPLEAIIAATRKPLTDNGLALVQTLDEGDLVTMLLHVGGARLIGRTPIPAVDGFQAFGSGITYLRRYSITAMLGIATEEDDDGNHADGNGAKFKPRPEPVHEPVVSDEPRLVGPWSGAGVIRVVKQGVADGNLRPGKDGEYFIVKFETVDNETIPQVLVMGGLALDILDAAGSDLNGMDAEISGDLYAVPFKGRTFQRVILKHIRTASWTLPVPVAPGQVGAFDAATEAELDGAL